MVFWVDSKIKEIREQQSHKSLFQLIALTVKEDTRRQKGQIPLTTEKKIRYTI